MMNRLLMVGPSGSNTWVATFNGTIYSEAVDAAGNSYIAAFSNSPSSRVLAKISPEGAILWSYAFSSNLDNSQARVCLNPSGTELYFVAPQLSFVGNAFYVAKFDTSGTLLDQKLFQDTSNFGNPYVWGAVAGSSFLYVSMQGYYSASGYASGIFKISTSSLSISERWSYSNSANRIRYLVLNSAGTALYAGTNTSIYGSVLLKIDTSNMGVAHSTYVSYNLSGNETIYGIAVDAAETNAYIVGQDYFTLSGFTQTWPVLYSITANGSTINWGRTARVTNTTLGYMDVQIDSSNNVYVAGDFYNGSIYKKQLLKLSSANVVLFSNAFDGSQQSNPDFNNLVICNENSTIKYGFRGTAASGQAFHSLPTNGTATGSYTVGSDTYTYGSFTPTYYSLSASRGNAGIGLLARFNNYAQASVSYTFPSITITLPKRDVP